MEYTELRKKGVYLGRAGEDGKRTVWLDVTAWNEQAGGGSGVLLYTSPKGQVWPLGTKTETDEDTGTVKLSAPITLAETAAAGIGHIEAQWMSGGEKVKSQTFNTLVLESAYTGETVPDKAPHWVKELIEELNAAGMLLEELGEVASEAHAAYDEIRETSALIGEALDTAEETVAQAQVYAETAAGHAATANNCKTAAEASAAAAAASAEEAMDATPDGYAAFVGSMAPAYSAVSGYAVGDMVLKDGQLYKCSSAIGDEGETWTAAHWTAVTAAGQIGRLAEETDLIKNITLTAAAGDSVEYTSDEQGIMWRYVNGAWQRTQTSGVAYYHVCTFPVTAGERYLIRGIHTTNCPAALFWTADGTAPFAYSSDGFDPEREREWVTMDITVPAGAAKMTLTGYMLTSFPTVNEVSDMDTGVAALDEYKNSVRFLKTTGFHVFDRAQRITVQRERSNIQISFPYQFYLCGNTERWVKTVTLAAGDASYRKTVTVPTNCHVVYNPTENDIEVRTWSEMGELAAAMDNYVLLGTNISGTLFGPLAAVALRNAENSLESGLHTIPYYYDEYMAGKVTEIEEACAFITGAAFVFITDTHLRMNTKQSGKLIRWLGEHTNAADLVVFGGDVAYAYDTEENVLADAQAWLEYMGQWGREKTIQVHGNHDYMCNSTENHSVLEFICTVGQLMYYIGNKGPLVRPAGKLYGYHDVPGQNVRIIVTDDYDTDYDGDQWTDINGAYSEEQLAYVKARILETDRHVVVVSHQSSDQEINGHVSVTTLQSLLIAAKNKTGDFAAWGGDIVAHLSGHNHNDESHVDNGLLSVTTGCDAGYNARTGYDRTTGTVNEQSFDVVCVDTTNKTMTMVRIGAGESRTFNY